MNAAGRVICGAMALVDGATCGQILARGFEECAHTDT